MAKIKLAKGRKKKGDKPRGAIPCIILIVSAMALFSMLFYALIHKPS